MLGYEMSGVIAIGDGLNDIEMIIYDSINDMDGFNKVNPNLLIINFNNFIYFNV